MVNISLIQRNIFHPRGFFKRAILYQSKKIIVNDSRTNYFLESDTISSEKDSRK